MRLDPHFREFLELDVILPISRGTQSLSGNNIWRMMNAWNDGIKTVYTVRMMETDQWFVDKTEHIMKIESQLLKLQVIAEAMVEQKKDLARHNRSLAKNLAMLGKAEDNKKMARLYVDVADVEDKVGGLHEEQVNIDLLLISATFRDYIGMIGSVKETLGVRKNAWQRWQEVLRDVNRKKDVMRKAEQEGKQETVRKLGREITERELQRDLAQNVFDNLSRNFKEEYKTFEVKNFYHFKKIILDYSDKMQNSATNIVSYWEGLLPKIDENDF